MHSSIGLRAVVVAGALLVLGAACAVESPSAPLGADGQPDAVLDAGRTIYSARCARCHGGDGAGGTGPKLSEGAVVAKFPEFDDQVTIIRNGKNGMPSFAGALSDEQIEAVTRYTREVLR